MYSYDKIAPAVHLALDRARQLYGDTIQFSWTYRRTGSCGPDTVGAEAAKAFYSTRFDVFIGPGE
jgi:hypothetical protein